MEARISTLKTADSKGTATTKKSDTLKKSSLEWFKLEANKQKTNKKNLMNLNMSLGYF